MGFLPGAEVGLFGQHALGAQPVQDLRLARPAVEKGDVQGPELPIGGVVEDELLAPVEDGHGRRELVQGARVGNHLLLQVDAHGFQFGNVHREAGGDVLAGHFDDLEAAAVARDHGGGAQAEDFARRALGDGDLARRRLQQLHAARNSVARVLGFHGAGISDVDPGELATGFARPGRAGDRVQHGLQRREFVGQVHLAVAQAHRLQPVAGDLSQPHHGAPGHRPAFDLQMAAAEAHGCEAESLAPLTEVGDGDLQLPRPVRREPGVEVQDATGGRHVAEQGQIAVDVGFVAAQPPGDHHLRFSGEERLRPIESRSQFDQLSREHRLALDPALAAGEVKQSRECREEHEADEEGQAEDGVIVAQVSDERLVDLLRPDARGMRGHREADRQKTGGTLRASGIAQPLPHPLSPVPCSLVSNESGHSSETLAIGKSTEQA